MRQCIDWLLGPEVRAETQEEDEVAGAHPSAVIRYKNRGATGKAAETPDLSSEIEEEEGAQSLYECPDGARIAKSEFFHRRLDHSLGRRALPNGLSAQLQAVHFTGAARPPRPYARYHNTDWPTL